MEKDSSIIKKGYPKDIYLVADEKNEGLFFMEDPIKKENRQKHGFDFARLVFDFMDGPSDIVNPYKIRFMVYKVNRGDAFDGAIPEKIRRGEIDAHIEDHNGDIIEITGRLNNDKEFPMNAVVYDGDGSIIETRKYSADGYCSDEDPSHRLVVMQGALDW